MEEIILISYLNDFIFCPVSIYFHKLYGALDKNLYQSTCQIDGMNAHKTIDKSSYSDKKNILQGIDVYSQTFGIRGKIDVFDIDKGILTERKNKITTIYDGYIFQVYAQYYALSEMGYDVKKIRFHSLKDNKNYDILLPRDDLIMDNRFKALIKEIHEFNMENFQQTNVEKCKKCIYEPACDRSLMC
ncbi:MAG: type V CRISPR-associated protein Cas4 [Bdellovibrionota bacterium]|jgi:CRISPR-associated exonuclease Cas4